VLFNLLYLTAMIVASPWIAYRAIAHGRYRRGVRQKLFGIRPSDINMTSQPTAWFHAVSVGEVNLLPGLVTAFRKRHPHWRVVISTSTDTGYDLALDRFSKTGVPVFFCPLDFSWAVKRTLRTLQPKLLVLAELELWPNLIRLATESGCQCAVVNARLSEKSFVTYTKASRFLRTTFQRLAWVGCQDHDYSSRFIACGTPETAVSVTGSLKFDDAPTTRDTNEVHDRVNWAGAGAWHQIMLAGSTHNGEERMAIDAYLQLRAAHPELRLIVSPRHATRFDEVAALIETKGLNCRRRSQSRAAATEWDADTVILVDTIGELRHWWGAARVAFVGGAFGERGGQNMLEPAGYGCAVCFGPNTKNFEDIARRLIAADGAVRLNQESELAEFVDRCLNDIPAADRLGIHAQAMVMSHRGATQRTIEHLAELATSREIAPIYTRAA
jgi:3-deoxy-D-manno-octulosonic-acid transferase